MDTNLDQLLFDKRTYYIRITRAIRWLAIAMVLATFPMDDPHAEFILMLSVSAVIYNFGWYIKPIYNQKWFGSFISMNISDNLFVAVLVVLTGGIFSPYYILFSFMAITLTYWYGYRGLGILTFFHILFALFLWQLLAGGAATYDLVRLPIILLFTFAINGILTERLTHSDREERKYVVRATRKIDAERQRLLSLVNSMGDGVIAIQKNGKILMYNGAALGLLDTNRQLIDSMLQEQIELRDENGEEVSLIEVINTATTVMRRRDLSLKAADGSTVNLDITISPITNNSSHSELDSGFIIILRDITKEKSLDEIRDEFISVTSHELRTPIAIAEANLSTALLPKFAPENEKAHELLSKAHQNVTFLAELVNDLATLARAERDSLELELAMIDPIKIMDGVADDYREQIEGKGLKLDKQYDKNVPKVLSSEPQIREILQNFITNAIKYTEEGTVGLIVSYQQEGKDNSRSVVFAVKDEGIGISASDKKYVYDKFYRSEDYRTRETGGTGLGLYITRKLAERLNGETWFESKLNKGSTFYLRIPVVTENEKDQDQVTEVQVEDFVTTL